MKRKENQISEKISIKWKIFLYLLGFTVILLAILWIFQICYLETFYKLIKSMEAVKAMEQTKEILGDADSDIETEIDQLAAEHNLSVLVADTEGNSLYNAEYTLNSRISEIPPEIFREYYEQAKEQGGEARIEFEGDRDVTARGPKEQPFHDEPAEQPGETQEKEARDIPEEDRMEPGEGRGFFQNHGQELAKSAIYVKIINNGSMDLVILVNSQLTPVNATVGTLRIQFVWISVILILLSLLIGFLLSRKISRSIIRVNRSAKELAKGDYSVEFSGRDYREITELSETLNYAARELEKTEELRRELIANVSHDLRTPLTMIIAYAEVLRDLPGENTPENIQVVIDESMRLTNLVNDMLDISKLQAGVLELEVSVYNLTESVRAVLERYNKLKEQEGCSIEFLYDREVFVEADEFKIFQVIYNLINNAINYTGEDRRVTVRQIVRGSIVRLEVCDTGAGIEKEALPYVWDRYYKVDKNHKRAVMGTGLGLSIVKSILALHKSVCGVESEVGKGSTFWFELPVSKRNRMDTDN